MSTSTDPTFVELVDARIDQVLKCPRGWGGVAALEPLVLMLLMLRASATNPDSDDIVVEEYRKFLAERVGRGAADLRARLGEECSEARMVEVLREHVLHVREQTGAVSDNARR